MSKMLSVQMDDSWDSEHSEDIPLDGGVKEQDPCWEDAKQIQKQ